MYPLNRGRRAAKPKPIHLIFQILYWNYSDQTIQSHAIHDDNNDHRIHRIYITTDKLNEIFLVDRLDLIE